jgi:hypothetical protein
MLRRKFTKWLEIVKDSKYIPQFFKDGDVIEDYEYSSALFPDFGIFHEFIQYEYVHEYRAFHTTPSNILNLIFFYAF